MRIALVINETAGQTEAGRTPGSIRESFAAAGVDVVPEHDGALPLAERLRIAAAVPDIDAVVVGGGDGTIACAAEVMAGRDLPLGLLPLGTMNLLAKDLGLPLDVDAAIAAIRSGAPRRIDVGEVNGHVFLINSILGMPARVARHREGLRQGFDARSALRWIVGVARHLDRYPKLSVSIGMNGATRHRRLRMLAVVNNDYIEAPGRILVRSPLDGGRLTLYAVSRLSLARAARLGFGFALGDWRSLPDLERHEVSDLVIVGGRRALRVMNDGEVHVIASPLRYTIRKRALAVILPRGEGSR